MEYAPYCPPVPEKKEIPIIINEPILEETQEAEGTEDVLEFRERTGATAQEIKDRLKQPEVSLNRSMSVSYHAQPGRVSKRNTFRRKSMDIIRKRRVDDLGSQKFRDALEQDASHEIHPGWNSIRQLAGMLGLADTITGIMQ